MRPSRRPGPGLMDPDESFSHHRTHLASAQVLHKVAPDECRVPKEPSIVTKSMTATVDVQWCDIIE